MQHFTQDRFVPAPSPRHARLFELIRQDDEARTTAPQDDPEPTTIAALTAFGALARQSLCR